MTHAETITRISEWMRFWAPEVKKRIDRGEALFAECKDAYGSVCSKQDDEYAARTCWSVMQLCSKELDKAPPGAYDHLAHIGTYIP
jgi:hypothetical protein